MVEWLGTPGYCLDPSEHATFVQSQPKVIQTSMTLNNVGLTLYRRRVFTGSKVATSNLGLASRRLEHTVDKAISNVAKGEGWTPYFTCCARDAVGLQPLSAL